MRTSGDRSPGGAKGGPPIAAQPEVETLPVAVCAVMYAGDCRAQGSGARGSGQTTGTGRA